MSSSSSDKGEESSGVTPMGEPDQRKTVEGHVMDAVNGQSCFLGNAQRVGPAAEFPSWTDVTLEFVNSE